MTFGDLTELRREAGLGAGGESLVGKEHDEVLEPRGAHRGQCFGVERLGTSVPTDLGADVGSQRADVELHVRRQDGNLTCPVARAHSLDARADRLRPRVVSPPGPRDGERDGCARGLWAVPGPEELRRQAYPWEWTIADVLSHVGSSAEIFRARFDASRAGTVPDDDFARPIWDTWNAKSPEAKAADALAVDRALVEALMSLTYDEREKVDIVFGPMRLDFPSFVSLRLNEHALHTWDVEVSLDPDATVAAYAVPEIVDRLESIVGFAGKPIGVERTLHVRTSEPDRDFTLALGADSISLSPRSANYAVDLEIPAEPFIRLVYGGLDPGHTPATLSGVDLSELRRVFPGL